MEPRLEREQSLEDSDRMSQGGLTEEVAVKGRSTVADIANFLHTMRASGEEELKTDDSPDMKERCEAKLNTLRWTWLF